MADTSLVYGDGNLAVDGHLASAQEFLQGTVLDWGNDGPTGNIRRSADLGKLEQSITGIAIGANSDVDQVQIQRWQASYTY